MRHAFIIPTYNRADLVVQAVESALGQTIPGDVAVVDDGSTDDTLERLSCFKGRIRILTQENAERGVARNRGAELVPEADLLFFLDADDVVKPDHAETLIDLAREHPDASLLATRGWETDGELSPVNTLGGHPESEVTLEGFLRGKEPLAPSLLAVPRGTFDAVGGFPEDRALAGSEDWVLVARALRISPAYRGSRMTLRMRKHPGNSMANAASMHRSMLLAHALLFGNETPHLLRPPRALEAYSRGDLLLRSATGYYASGEMRSARRTLLDAVRSSPSLLLEARTPWTLLRSLLGKRLSSSFREWKQGPRTSNRS